VEGREEVAMAAPPLIAYAPLKRIIKQEMPDERVGNNTGEGNWTLQVITAVCL